MATIDPSLPNAQSQLVETGGTATRPMYQWMLSTQRDLVSLKQSSSMAPAGDFLSTSTTVVGIDSILFSGSLASGSVQLFLDGDEATATPTQYYGSNASSVKGWHNVSDALAGTSNIARIVDPVTAVTSFDLVDVTVTAGGTLKLRSFDSKGRLSQEATATTDNLPEGTTNLYYTDARARRVVIFPVVTGEVPPVLVYAEDGSLIYTEIF